MRNPEAIKKIKIISTKIGGSHCRNILTIFVYELNTNELAITYENRPSIRPNTLR